MLAAAVALAMVSRAFSGIVWQTRVGDEADALMLVGEVRSGGALVVGPVEKAEQFEVLAGEFGGNGVPSMGKDGQGRWTFDLKRCRGWERPSFSPPGRGDGAVLLRLGRGLVVLTTFDGRGSPEFVATLERELALQNAGIAFRGIVCGRQTGGGRTRDPFRGAGFVAVNLSNTSTGAVAAGVVFTLTSAAGQARFTGEGMKETAGEFGVRAVGDFLAYGPCGATLSLTEKQTGRTYLLKEWTLDWPDYFQIVLPDYRGMVSTARRDPAVHLGAAFDKGRQEDFSGRALQATVHSPDGANVLDFQGTFGASGSLAFDVPLPRDAAPGVYTVRADSTRADGGGVHAEAAFKVVPVRDGQVFIDQDGALLANGRPWYPFGLYHLANRGDFDAVAELGIDLAQVWSGGVTKENLEYLKNKGIRIAFETDAWGQVINNWAAWRGSPPPVINFETNANFRAHAERVLAEPNALAFWYTADEADAAVLPGVKRIRKYWEALDPEDHPTYLVTTRDPAMSAGGDILGLDCYPRSFGAKRPMTDIADLLDGLYRDAPPGRCVIAVPQSFGRTARHQETPEELKCMAYLAMVHGAKGVFWYCWWDPGNQGASRDPAARQAIKEVTHEAKAFKLALLAPGFMPFRSEDGRVHACLCGDASTGRFLLCVNGADDPSDGVIHAKVLKGLEFEPLFGSPAVMPDAGGRLVAPLAAAARAVWRVK